MRMVLVVATSALVAGCSATAGDDQRPSSAPTTSSPSATVSTISKAPGTRTSAPSTPPTSGAATADVIRWIEAARPADVGAYHSVTRDGVTTDLGDQVAFITAGTEANCLTNRYQDGALSCLVKLTNPPPRPPGIETGWKNNWVDFTGTSVDVGSPHGDPGPFVDGTGAELPSAQSLAFGDYRCRADAGAVFCVNYAHQTAVKMSAAGVEGFGCLQQAPPPAGIGLRLSC